MWKWAPSTSRHLIKGPYCAPVTLLSQTTMERTDNNLGTVLGCWDSVAEKNKVTSKECSKVNIILLISKTPALFLKLLSVESAGSCSCRNSSVLCVCRAQERDKDEYLVASCSHRHLVLCTFSKGSRKLHC